MDTINYIYVGVLPFMCAVIRYKVSCVCCELSSADLDRYHSIVPRWYFESRLDNLNCGFLSGGVCEGQESAIALNVALLVFIPGIRQ